MFFHAGKERFRRKGVAKHEKRLGRFAAERPVHQIRHRLAIHAPLHAEEMESLDNLVPYWFVFLAPDAFPVSCHVGREDVPHPFLRVRIEAPDERSLAAVGTTIQVVVARNEELRDLVSSRCAVIGECLVPGICVGLHLLDLPEVRKVPAVHDRVHVRVPEMLQGLDEILARPFPVDPSARGHRPQVRIADDAHDQIRLFRRFPAGRCSKKPPRAQRERRSP